MATRLINLVVSSLDPTAQARFWGDLLGWGISFADGEEVDLQAPDGDGWRMDLVFVPVPEPKAGKNRVHLDLSSATQADRDRTVARALDLGARHADIGQGDTPWVVLADPEGNEFCVLEPRAEYRETGAVAAIVLDAHEPGGLAAFWAEATGWPVVRDTAEFASLRDKDGLGPWLEFLRVDEPKAAKNRLHLDVAGWPNDSIDAEVDRLVGGGARPHDELVGLPWRVLFDPEGNEFCVLTSR
ncbi:VOC family protein [Actinokineospora sp. HUAS TT18]|uniref:VOC family protein n=1 Tax=Actinokineospora sp. HUAS TT18 TaxID=3447451 RepID=UPI003F525BAE